MQKALITGGGGFLGHVIGKELMARGIEPIAFDSGYPKSKTLTHFRGSILSPDDLTSALQGVSMVFHVAGVLGTSELLQESGNAVDVNIRGTVNVLEACRRMGVQKIFYPTKPNDWLNTYSITKRAGEEFVRMYSAEFGIEGRVLRWLNAYGPGQKLLPVRKAVPVMIAQALNNLDIDIWGTGEQPVDLIYTDDLARISVEYTLATGIDASVRDTGCTIRLTVNDLAMMIRELCNSNSEIRHHSMRRGEDQEKTVTLLSGTDAATILGLSGTAKNLQAGIRETIEYYRSLPDAEHRKVVDYYQLQRRGMRLAA